MKKNIFFEMVRNGEISSELASNLISSDYLYTGAIEEEAKRRMFNSYYERDFNSVKDEVWNDLVVSLKRNIEK